MQRFLVITDSFKLQYLINSGELRVAPFEFKLIESPLPTTQVYLDLLTTNPNFGSLHDKVFLIIGTNSNAERDTSLGLNFGISEVEFLVALNRTAAGTLRKKYPELHFETLPQGISRSFLAARLNRWARAGAGAIAVLLGLKEPPLILSSKSLIELTPVIPHDVMRGLLIATSRKASCRECPLNVRTFMTLLVAYKRTLPYPEGNAGYVLDMLEIYHYAVNRYDTEPFNPAKMDHIREMYEFLMHLPPELTEISLLDLIEQLKTNPAFERFFKVLSNFSGGQGPVPFCLLRALDGFGLLRANTPSANVRFSYQHLISVANEIENYEDKVRFALILGSIVGYQRVAYTLYSRETLHILQDFQDSKTDIETETDDLNSPLTQVASAPENLPQGSNPGLNLEANENAMLNDHLVASAPLRDEERLVALTGVSLDDEEHFADLVGIPKTQASNDDSGVLNVFNPSASANDNTSDNSSDNPSGNDNGNGNVNGNDSGSSCDNTIDNVTPRANPTDTETGVDASAHSNTCAKLSDVSPDLNSNHEATNTKNEHLTTPHATSLLSDEAPSSSSKQHQATMILNRIRTTAINPNLAQDLHAGLISATSSNDETSTPDKLSSKPNSNVLPGYETIETAPIAALTSADNNRFGITPFYTEGLIRFLDDDEEDDEDSFQDGPARQFNNQGNNPTNNQKNYQGFQGDVNNVEEFRSVSNSRSLNNNEANSAKVDSNSSFTATQTNAHAALGSSQSQASSAQANLDNSFDRHSLESFDSSLDNSLDQSLTNDCLENAPEDLNPKVVSLFDHLTKQSLEPSATTCQTTSDFSPVQVGSPPITPYVFACTDGFSEALSMLTDLSAMPDAEIRSALEAVVLTESPIAEEFVIDRFRLLCRRADLPFKKNVEERRFRIELLNVCEALKCTQDEEGFIYLPNSTTVVRKRSPDGLSRTMRRAMNRADTVSSREIMAAYQHLFKSGLGISRPEPIDIIELLGLCQRRYAHKEDIERIAQILKRHLGN
ncbi:MAG: hypothetical protein U0L03_04095 [Succinivibrionaceae bacterium]|nr:hypothetical protein [Succinivibrionaceae bacterium]